MLYAATRPGENVLMKISDFGISKMLKADQKAAVTFIGRDYDYAPELVTKVLRLLVAGARHTTRVRALNARAPGSHDNALGSVPVRPGAVSSVHRQACAVVQGRWQRRAGHHQRHCRAASESTQHQTGRRHCCDAATRSVRGVDVVALTRAIAEPDYRFQDACVDGVVDAFLMISGCFFFLHSRLECWTAIYSIINPPQ